jgi:predicted nucleic acid-binding protein
MSYLIDTNIVSETAKKTPNKGVLKWFNATPYYALFISVITLGEIRKGIEAIKDDIKKNELINWLDFELRPWFGNNIISIDQAIAERWGYITANTKVPAIDGLIAATAMVSNLTLITRNTKDFVIPGLEVINPFY